LKVWFGVAVLVRFSRSALRLWC